MPVTLDRHTRVELSTAAVPAREAFAYWREMICATFVRLAADPVVPDGFQGRIEHVPVGELELSTVVAGSQHVRRTPALIGRSNEEYLLASIQLRGQGRVEQDGRVAILSRGAMAFYDSTRPYVLHFDDPFEQLVVQVPRAQLALRDTRRLTARALGTSGSVAAVPAFFTSLAYAVQEDADGSALLLPHALGLLTAAASLAGRHEPEPDAADALVREQVLDHLQRNAADPRLDAATVAAACGMSRRTLYRVVGRDGVASQLRRIRIDRARAMLLDSPQRPVSVVAARCGFDSESGFYRAFRAATGRTPGEYRREHELGTAGQ